MKKKIIAAAVLVVLAALAVAAALLLNSPLWALKTMRDDIQAHGVGALRGYLTEDLRVQFDFAASAYGAVDGVARGLGAVTDTIKSLTGLRTGGESSGGGISALFSGMRDGSDSFKAGLSGIRTEGDNAEVTLDFSVGKINSSAMLAMVRREGRWLISDIWLPDYGWWLAPPAFDMSVY